MKPLALGRCRAAPRRFIEADLDALVATPGPHRFPDTSRAGFLERALWPTPVPRHAGAPFVAIARDLNAAHMLALAAQGAVGFVVEGPRGPERHAVVLATALGLPMAAGTLPDTLPDALTLDLDGAVTVERAGALVAGTERVLPLTLLPEGPSRDWIELIGAQPEERHLARGALEAGRASGVGLVRLEMLFFADPDLDPEDLTDHLTELLTDLARWPVALRLTDWSETKRPPRDTALQSWDGRRGIAGIIDTPAMPLQISAIRTAAARSGHPEVWCLAPHLEDLTTISKLRRHLGELRLGGMLESLAALNQIGTLADALDGIWIGGGDLIQALGTAEALAPHLERAARAIVLPLHVCG